MANNEEFLVPRPGEKLSFEELRALEKEMLHEFMQFCADHRIRFWLAYGSLLGAVRHADMIPWDDDIDIVMPKSDYNKLLEVVKSLGDGVMITENLKLVAPTTDPNAYAIFPKIVDVRTRSQEELLREDLTGITTGVWLDIFVLYGHRPSSVVEKIARVAHQISFVAARLGTFKALPSYSLQGKLLHAALGPIVKLTGHRLWVKAADSITRHCFAGCENATHLFIEAETDKLLPRSMFERTKLMDFGSYRFPVPAGYDEFLRISYGDSYRELPPEADRYSHSLDAWWL